MNIQINIKKLAYNFNDMGTRTPQSAQDLPRGFQGDFHVSTNEICMFWSSEKVVIARCGP